MYAAGYDYGHLETTYPTHEHNINFLLINIFLFCAKCLARRYLSYENYSSKN